MSCSPKFADSPGSSSGGFSPFSNHIASKIGMRNIWFLKDKQAVVEEYEQQGEPSFKVFFANYNNLVAIAAPSPSGGLAHGERC